jgi:hypothetical protein
MIPDRCHKPSDLQGLSVTYKQAKTGRRYSPKFYEKYKKYNKHFAKRGSEPITHQYKSSSTLPGISSMFSTTPKNKHN